MENIDDLSFEEALENLEIIVKQLEEENIPLEKAIDLYQKGMKLTHKCQTKLKDAEEKMVKVIQNNELEDFEVEEDK